MWMLTYQEEIETSPQYTCDFWIYQYEISYDLDKRCYSRENSETGSGNIQMDQFNDGDNEATEHMTSISDLPTEIISNVFSYLTPIDLLVIRDVCCLWRAIVLEDKSLWNHAHFTSTDLDVKVLYGKRKTTVSLLKEMPLLRSVGLCNVHSVDDMTRLITALCELCWDLRQIVFPDHCEWHPSPLDLYQLCYYHPCITSLHIATKQKLSPFEITNLGLVLADFHNLTDLKLVGFYWHQAELLPELLAKVKHLAKLSLPSLPGLSITEFQQLRFCQPTLKRIKINTSSLISTPKSKILSRYEEINVIDNSSLTPEKLSLLDSLQRVTYLDLNLSSSKKDDIITFMKKPRPDLNFLKISNCEYSDELLNCLSTSTVNLRSLVWINPKDVNGEITDEGVLAIAKLPRLQSLQIKSRSISRAYYHKLWDMKSLKYVRINGMRIPGCR